MGSRVTTLFPLASDIAVGATFSIPYPSGFTQASLLNSAGGSVAVNDNEVFHQGIGAAFTFGASNITIQNNSPIVWPAGSILNIGLSRTNPRGSNNLVFGTRPGEAAPSGQTGTPITISSGAVLQMIGDSTVAGVATGGGTSQVANSWPTQLAALLNAGAYRATAQNRYGCASGTWANLLTMDGRVTGTGAWSQTGTLGPGGNLFGATAAGSATFVLGTCNKIVVEWIDNAAGRTFTYAVDGGATTDVNTTGVYAIRRTVIPVTLGSHSLTLAWKTTSCNIRGVEAYDDSTAMPIRALNFGISGATSTNLANDSGTADSRLASYRGYGADVTFHEFGIINDAVQAIADSVTQANIIAIDASAAQSKAGHRNVYVTPNPIGDNATIRAALDSKVGLMRQLAAQRNALLIDVYAEFGTYEDAVARGLMSDTRHPNTAGYAVIANLVNRSIKVA